MNKLLQNFLASTAASAVAIITVAGNAFAVNPNTRYGFQRVDDHFAKLVQSTSSTGFGIEEITNNSLAAGEIFDYQHSGQWAGVIGNINNPDQFTVFPQLHDISAINYAGAAVGNTADGQSSSAYYINPLHQLTLITTGYQYGWGNAINGKDIICGGMRNYAEDSSIKGFIFDAKTNQRRTIERAGSSIDLLGINSTYVFGTYSDANTPLQLFFTDIAGKQPLTPILAPDSSAKLLYIGRLSNDDLISFSLSGPSGEIGYTYNIVSGKLENINQKLGFNSIDTIDNYDTGLLVINGVKSGTADKLSYIATLSGVNPEIIQVNDLVPNRGNVSFESVSSLASNGNTLLAGGYDGKSLATYILTARAVVPETGTAALVLAGAAGFLIGMSIVRRRAGKTTAAANGNAAPASNLPKQLSL